MWSDEDFVNSESRTEKVRLDHAKDMGNLTKTSPVGKKLRTALESGVVLKSTTARSLKESGDPLSEALEPYTTKSINNFLERYRRKTKNNDGK